MKVNWKRLVLELILGVMMELSPNYLDKLATITEYMVDLSTSKATIQMLFPKICQRTEYKVSLISTNKLLAPSLPI